MRVLGLQSGTSMDGVDAALVDLRPDAGGLRAHVAAYRQEPYPPALRDRLAAAVYDGRCDPRGLTVLDTEVGQCFADIAARFAGTDLIASMGQTLYHWVDGGTVRGTMQIGRPAWIAERTGVPVAADFRPRDVAAGGQGAPLVPILDDLLLRGTANDGPRALVNIGGIANITVARAGAPTTGYDIGPGNALLDAAWARSGSDDPYDTDAAVAATGTVHEPTLHRLCADPYYRRHPPKSTGKEHFNLAVLAGIDLPLPDLLRTLTALTAGLIADTARAEGVRELLLSGGGAANPLLRNEIARLADPIPVHRTDRIGVPPDAKEAVLAALLGWLTWHGLPGNLPTATGAAGPRILGSLTPGHGPLRLPQPRDTAPAWLRFDTEGENA